MSKQDSDSSNSQASAPIAVLPPDYIIDNKWKIIEKIGQGTFGQVYSAATIINPGEILAIKVAIRKEYADDYSNEIAALMSFKSVNAKRLLHFCGSGTIQDGLSYVVMQKVGYNVQELASNLPPKFFGLSSSLHIATESLFALQELHQLGYIHRDVKPGNMAIGNVANKRTIYILDYGSCQKYVDHLGQHLPPKSYVNFRGTVRYASISALDKKDISRKDDLMSWFYSIIDLTANRLPWDKQSAECMFKNVAAWTLEKKRFFNANVSLLIDRCPDLYRNIFAQISNLSFSQDPNYAAIHEILGEIGRFYKYDVPLQIDW